jgi:ComF family protein
MAPAHRCGTCLLDPPPYMQARAVGLYHGVLRGCIHAMKYEGIYGLVKPLAALLAAQFGSYWGEQKLTAIVPVPLHRTKLQTREFDQALELARHVSQAIHLPLWGDGLVRHRRTASQVGLNAAQRRHNVRGAFRLKDPQACVGKAFLLIDDVYTTGATLRECAGLLRQAGAVWVGTYTLARVGEPGLPPSASTLSPAIRKTRG